MSQTKDLHRERNAKPEPPRLMSQTREVQIQPPPRSKFSLVLTYDPATDAAGLMLVDPAAPPARSDVARALLLLRDSLIAEMSRESPTPPAAG